MQTKLPVQWVRKIFPWMQCSWGSKPTLPGASSAPLPPPVAGIMPGYSAELAIYERQLAVAKMSGMQALMHPQTQHMLKQAAMGMGAAGTNQAIYDCGYQSSATAQQLMYYQ